jgi:integrase
VVAVALPAGGRKQATIDVYSHIVRRHLVPALGSKTLDRLRPSDLEALILAKRREGLAPSTVRTIYTVLRGALDVAVRDGVLARNPAAVVRRPTIDPREARYLTVQQAQQLLDAMRGDRLECLFRLMLATGLRRGEALGLHWSTSTWIAASSGSGGL